MTSFYEPAGWIEQSDIPGRSAGESAQKAAISADNRASVEFIAQQQQQQQAKINTGRNPSDIGSAP
jgi:hypothetical protein